MTPLKTLFVVMGMFGMSLMISGGFVFYMTSDVVPVLQADRIGIMMIVAGLVVLPAFIRYLVSD